MRVICPFTNIHPEMLDALDASGWGYSLVDVSDSDESYWSLVAELWRDCETFAIVEHDVVIRRGVLDELADCPNPWCSFATPYMSGTHHGMGCVKFGAEILTALPQAVERAGEWSNGKHSKRHWCVLDHALQYVVLPSSGRTRHAHEPPVGHLNDWPAHGCHGARGER